MQLQITPRVVTASSLTAQVIAVIVPEAPIVMETATAMVTALEMEMAIAMVIAAAEVIMQVHREAVAITATPVCTCPNQLTAATAAVADKD